MKENLTTYLIQNGYIQMWRDSDNRKLLKINGYNNYYSTMGNIESWFIPEDYAKIHNYIVDINNLEEVNYIIWGLYEHKVPPTLIYPRPAIFNEKDGADISTFSTATERVLKSNPNEIIFRSLFNQQIKFNIDFQDELDRRRINFNN